MWCQQAGGPCDERAWSGEPKSCTLTSDGNHCPAEKGSGRRGEEVVGGARESQGEAEGSVCADLGGKPKVSVSYGHCVVPVVGE